MFILRLWNRFVPLAATKEKGRWGYLPSWPPTSAELTSVSLLATNRMLRLPREAAALCPSVSAFWPWPDIPRPFPHVWPSRITCNFFYSSSNAFSKPSALAPLSQSELHRRCREGKMSSLWAGAQSITDISGDLRACSSLLFNILYTVLFADNDNNGSSDVNKLYEHQEGRSSDFKLLPDGENHSDLRSHAQTKIKK